MTFNKFSDEKPVCGEESLAYIDGRCRCPLKKSIQFVTIATDEDTIEQILLTRYSGWEEAIWVLLFR